MTRQEEEAAPCSAVWQYLYRKADNLDHKYSGVMSQGWNSTLSPSGYEKKNKWKSTGKFTVHNLRGGGGEKRKKNKNGKNGNFFLILKKKKKKKFKY